MAIRYFKVDNRRFSFRECWHLAPGILAKLFLLGAKLLGIRFRAGEGYPLPDAVLELQVTEAELPDEARNELAPVLAEFQALGFHSPQFQFARNTLAPNVQVVIVTLLHAAGEMLGFIAYSKTTLVQPPRVKIQSSFTSLLSDERQLTTSNASRQLDPLPGCQVAYHTGRSPAATYEAHRARLQNRATPERSSR